MATPQSPDLLGLSGLSSTTGATSSYPRVQHLFYISCFYVNCQSLIDQQWGFYPQTTLDLITINKAGRTDQHCTASHCKSCGCIQWASSHLHSNKIKDSSFEDSIKIHHKKQYLHFYLHTAKPHLTSPPNDCWLICVYLFKYTLCKSAIRSSVGVFSFTDSIISPFPTSSPLWMVLKLLFSS